MAFSLVTPYVTDKGLERVGSLLEALQDEMPDAEVIINDWGVLFLLERRFPSFLRVLGRLLTKQKRCPTLIRLLERKPQALLRQPPKDKETKCILIQKKLPSDLDLYYRGSNVSSVPIIHSFLASRRIKRIEIDNLAHGMTLSLPKDKIQASVYFPYVYISTTFFCLSSGCDDKEISFLKIKRCAKQCQEYIFTLRHPSMPRLIYLKGNTQFYRNKRLPNAMEKMGINRTVYEPEIPV
jgi:hypothetical protein